jgi:hypothetical protein
MLEKTTEGIFSRMAEWMWEKFGDRAKMWAIYTADAIMLIAGYGVLRYWNWPNVQSEKGIGVAATIALFVILSLICGVSVAWKDHEKKKEKRSIGKKPPETIVEVAKPSPKDEQQLLEAKQEMKNRYQETCQTINNVREFLKGSDVAKTRLDIFMADGDGNNIVTVHGLLSRLTKIYGEDSSEMKDIDRTVLSGDGSSTNRVSRLIEILTMTKQQISHNYQQKYGEPIE